MISMKLRAAVASLLLSELPEDRAIQVSAKLMPLIDAELQHGQELRRFYPDDGNDWSHSPVCRRHSYSDGACSCYGDLP